MSVDRNVPCVSYSPKCCYGHLWDWIWWYAPYTTIVAMTVDLDVAFKKSDLALQTPHWPVL